MASAVRPQLRGLLSGQLKKHAVICSVISVAAVCYTEFIYKQGRMKKYEEFYKSYNPQKDFERMRDAGVFRSVKPEPAE